MLPPPPADASIDDAARMPRVPVPQGAVDAATNVMSRTLAGCRHAAAVDCDNDCSGGHR